MSVTWVPKGFPRLAPGIAVVGCNEAIELYVRIFGARERARFSAPDGTVLHCELAFGDSVLMLGEAQGAPKGARLMLYVEDCDAVFAKAVAAGAKVLQPLDDQFYGDRTGRLIDPFGIEWYVATHVEDVSEQEQRRRFAMLAARTGAN